MALKRLLIVSDAHRPYHDQRAWDLMLKVGEAFRPHILTVIGDLADFYAVSSHSKDPLRQQQLAWEVEDINTGLDQLDALGAKDKHFIAGNHCDRLTRYLKDRAPELFDTISIPGLFKLKDRGWHYIPYKSDMKIGKLWLTHDVGNSGRNAVFRALDTYQHSIVTGHTHRMQYICEGNAAGEYKVSAMFGWLGDRKQIDYMHRAKVYKDWALGFGIGYHDPDTGVVYLVPVPIINYTAVVEGKLYRG